jgi:hypothetical protein
LHALRAGFWFGGRRFFVGVQVLGRNCRFLQGPKTSSAKVALIRAGIVEGTDVSVCLLNYRSDGAPFWNQFFVAALRDGNNRVVNYVGVQVQGTF